MKRIHLFEFEDQTWFPNWLRICITRLIVVVHRMLKTSEDLANVLAKAIKNTGSTRIIDLCSGSAGPMPEVMWLLEEQHGIKNLSLELTDLYPNQELAKKINSQNNPGFKYNTHSVDATTLNGNTDGLRTMICSMHHMKPDVAKQILKSAKDAGKPICVFEISDNGVPLIMNIIAFPINIIMCLVVTLFARPLTLQQIVFTYLIPIIPIFYAWDGAVSNARTYTLSDMDILLEGLHDETYTWEKGVIKNRGNKLYLLGIPTKN